MTPVGNRNYLVCNLTILDLNHLITDYRTNYKAERYIMSCFFQYNILLWVLINVFLYK